jgi:flagellar hook capping protein FlgD
MVGGGSTGTGIVTTAGALAAVPGHLYVAAIASKSSNTVTSVTGLGLSWTRVRNQCGARSQTGVEVWVGSGTPSAGSVTATFQSAPTNAVLLAARYSGADPANPIGHVVSGNTLGTNGVCSGGTDNGSFSFNLTTAEGSLVLGAVAARSKTLTPGAGSTKRGQIFQGADTGSMATVSIMDKTATGASTVIDGTFNGSVDWAVIGVEILPQVLVTKTTVVATASHATVLHVFPNPFTRGTWIEYDLPSPTQVEAAVYNARGQRVRTLAAERQVPGRWRLYWDGRSDQGTGVAAGIYFLRAQFGDITQTRKVVLQR